MPNPGAMEDWMDDAEHTVARLKKKIEDFEHMIHGAEMTLNKMAPDAEISRISVLAHKAALKLVVQQLKEIL